MDQKGPKGVKLESGVGKEEIELGSRRQMIQESCGKGHHHRQTQGVYVRKWVSGERGQVLAHRCTQATGLHTALFCIQSAARLTPETTHSYDKSGI